MSVTVLGLVCGIVGYLHRPYAINNHNRSVYVLAPVRFIFPSKQLDRDTQWPWVWPDGADLDAVQHLLMELLSQGAFDHGSTPSARRIAVRSSARPLL
jgi:hypothetical protein